MTIPCWLFFLCIHCLKLVAVESRMQLKRGSKYSKLLMLLLLWFSGSALEGHGFAEYTAILLCDKASTVQFTYHDDQLNIHSSVICSPLQEFYVYDTRTWIPAYQLKPGDRLFSVCGFCVIELVENNIGKQAVYLIEIEDTHTFFVGRSGLLTHNMGLPYTVNVGLSIPLGLAAGSGMGSFFGPITLVAGVVIGSAIGIATQIICGNRLTEYKIGTPPEEWHDYLQLHEAQTPSNKDPQQGNNVNGPNNNKQPKKSNNNNKKVLEAVKGAKDVADKIAKDAQKQRRIQPLSKTEAAAKIKDRYEHFDQNIYRLRDGKEPLRTPEGKAIERIEWDNNHFGEWEAYADVRGKKHLGALDPETLQLYKKGDPARFSSN
jgi:hypothetical protein